MDFLVFICHLSKRVKIVGLDRGFMLVNPIKDEKLNFVPVLFWIFTFFFFFILMHFFTSLVLPFLVGFLLFLIFHPLMSFLIFCRLPRWASATLFITFLYILFSSLLIFLIFFITFHFNDFIENFLVYKENILNECFKIQESFKDFTFSPYLKDIFYFLPKILLFIIEVTSDFLLKIFIKSFNIFHTVSLLIFSPLIAFYFMKDWPKMIQTYITLAPTRYQGDIERIYNKMAQKIKDFGAGLMVSSALATLYYGIAFKTIGLHSWLLSTLLSGLLAVFPLGMFLSFSVVALIQWIPLDLTQAPFLKKLTIAYLIWYTIDSWIVSFFIMIGKTRIHPLLGCLAFLGGLYFGGMTGAILGIPLTLIFHIFFQEGLHVYKNTFFYQKER